MLANCLMLSRSMHFPTVQCYPDDTLLYVSFNPKQTLGKPKLLVLFRAAQTIYGNSRP